MSTLDEIWLMTSVARLYFEKKLSQSQIAEQMDLSQATISRLIKHAKEKQIVRTVVTVPSGVYTDLEEALKERFNLKNAIVADCEDQSDDEIFRSIGSAAAYYLETTVKNGDVIGISSWSSSLLAMVNAMNSVKAIKNTQVVQILGGLGNPAAEVHANHLTRRLAELIRGKAIFLPAPGVADSVEMKNMILQDHFVNQAVEKFNSVTLALVGIGALEPSRLLASSGNRFTPKELEELQKMGAVGDICLRFFDMNGVPINSVFNERVISMPLEKLKEVKRCVGVAGGKRKYDAIRAALNGKWINVLVTDRYTAKHIINNET
ncbi:MAG: sugar-binding transcriptional regulator [bacterium]